MKRLLLVEDNRLTQDLVQDILTGMTYSSPPAAPRRCACAASRPDLLILDLNLVTPPERAEKKLSGWNYCAGCRWAIPSSS